MRTDVINSKYKYLLHFIAFICFPSIVQAQQPASAPAISTQPVAATEQSFHFLIAAGFKIVATTFIPADESNKQASMVVTLQSDRSVAVCTFNYTNWENIGTSPSLDNLKLCDVRTF